MLNRSLRAPSQCSAISRWPVLEIGRNSVMPSMRPSSRAANRSVMKQPGLGVGLGIAGEREHSGRDARPDLVQVVAGRPVLVRTNAALAPSLLIDQSLGCITDLARPLHD